MDDLSQPSTSPCPNGWAFAEPGPRAKSPVDRRSAESLTRRRGRLLSRLGHQRHSTSSQHEGLPPNPGLPVGLGGSRLEPTPQRTPNRQRINRGSADHAEALLWWLRTRVGAQQLFFPDMV